MTNECEYNGTLRNHEDINDLLYRIEYLACMIHQIYLNKPEDEIPLTSYNGVYDGNFAIRKDFLSEHPDGISDDIIVESKRRYVDAMIKYNCGKNIEISEPEIESLCDKFFEKYLFLNQVNIKGITFKHSTDPSDKIEDFENFSTISFIFMLDANIGVHKIEKLKNNMVELYNIKEKRENELSHIETMIFSPNFSYRHYSLYEMFNLFYWYLVFYEINDFNIDVMYSSYECHLFDEYEDLKWKHRDDIFVTIKKGFAERVIDMRATENVFSDKDYNSDNFNELYEKYKKILWDKYKDLIEFIPIKD